jgi:hypothetical protein
MAAHFCAGAMLTITAGVGSATFYSKFQHGAPVSMLSQVGVVGLSSLCSSLYLLWPKARRTPTVAILSGTTLSAVYYCAGGATGTALSALENTNRARHEDV